MTSEFVSAAELMARVLGADGFSFVTTEHPISSATPAQLAARARKAAAESCEILVGPSGRGR